MSKITKRDMAILGGFLVVIVVAAGAMIARQTQAGTSARSTASALAASLAESAPSDELAPEGGLASALGLIADPRAFQPERATGGTAGSASGRTAAASLPSHPGAAGAPTDTGNPTAAGPGSRPRGSYGGGSFPRGAGGTATVYIAGIAGRGDQLRALVVQKSGGGTRWLSLGESAFGYTLESATAQKAVLSKGGARFELEIGQGAPAGEAPAAPAPTAGPPTEGPKEAASPDAQAKFIGTWNGSMQGMTMTITFSAGGRGTMSISVMPELMTFTWHLEGSTLKMGMSMGGMMQPEQAVTYRFADNDATLYLTGPGQPEMRLTKSGAKK